MRIRSLRIEWRVLAREGNHILVISKCALSQQDFETDWEKKSASWEECSLRTWLNGRFIEEAFSKDEQKFICSPNEVANGASARKLPGSGLTDRVFLLSESEAETLFEDAEDRRCAVTDFARNLYSWRDGKNICCNSYSCGTKPECERLKLDHIDGKPLGMWWLRTTSDYIDDSVKLSDYDGTISGTRFNYAEYVRPVVWIAIG